MSEDDLRRWARQKAEARYGFRWHLPIYIIVNGMLALIWYFTGGGFPWPLFPIFFWGIGVFSHYMSAYRGFGREWIDAETDKILRKEQERRSSQPS